MRSTVLLITLLLLFVPLVGAQQGCPDCEPQGERGERGPGGGNETSNPGSGNETAGNGTSAGRGPCPDTASPRCREAHDRFRNETEEAAGDARYVSFRVDRDNRTLRDYTVDGHLAFDAIVFSDPGELEVDTHGVVLRIRTNESVLRLHDNVRGNVEYKSDNHSLTLDLPPGAFLDRHGQTERGHFLVVDYGTHTGKLAADGLLIDGDKLHLSGHAAFHVQPKQPEPQSTPAQQEVQEALAEAEEKRQLGARVAIRAGGPPVATLPSGSAGVSADMEQTPDSSVEVTTYDDLEVAVALPPELQAGGVIDVTVGAELEEGRTVALELDPAVLDGLTVGQSGEAAPRYFDLNDDGTWTEVVFRKADSIHDILDAQDDGGQPEYWVVQDEQGLQVLVSFPHWSVHRVSLVLEEVVDFVTQPSVLVGVVAGLGGVAVAAATLFMPRRRQEDLY